MYRIWVSLLSEAKGASDFINKITVNNVSKLLTNQAQYSAMLYEDGGIIDDLLVYKKENEFMVVVNAANLEKDLNWMKDHLSQDVELINASDSISLLAIQGRNATEVIQSLTDVQLDEIKYYWFRQGEVAGVPVIISRTGYTGEDGVELYVANEYATTLWDAIFKSGKDFDIEPIGLGARDTLRLEMKFALYGNDIDKTTNPIEAGLGWITKVNKGEFIGREAIIKVKEKGIARKLIGFEIEGKSIPRHGYACKQGSESIGTVTSGCWSPSLEKGIGMAYLEKEYTPIGTKFMVEIRNKLVPATVVETPFYKRPY